jgi:hypothetical protein
MLQNVATVPIAFQWFTITRGNSVQHERNIKKRNRTVCPGANSGADEYFCKAAVSDRQ